MPDTVICSKGHKNPKGAKFCCTCSEKIEVPKHVKCHGCGYDNAFGGKFCNNCGKPLGGNISAGGGVNLGDTGMIKDSNISATTNIQNREYKGASAVGGSQTINIGSEGRHATKTGAHCPICGFLDYFKCKKCGRNYICEKHHNSEYNVCEECVAEIEGEEKRKAEIRRKKEAEEAEAEMGQMVTIPAGEFLMGAGEDDCEAADREKPQHKVYLDAYYTNHEK